MRASKTTARIAALVAVGACFGVYAGGVIGGGPDPGPGPPQPSPGAVDVLTADPVRELTDPKQGDGARVFYLETTDPETVEPGPGGFIVKRCPKGSRTINGYFYRTVQGPKGEVGVYEGFGLDEQGSSPRGFYKWAFYFDNVTSQPIDGVTFGIVCDKDG